MKVEDEIHPSTFNLSVDNTGEGRYFLFNKYFDTTVRLYNVRKTSGQGCMSAVNTTSVPATTAMMEIRIQRFVANDTSGTFVGTTLNHIRRVGSDGVREHQSSGN